jgi:hypothetical protein
VVLSGLLVLLGSLLDALLTILHVQSGGSELNPLMAVALAHGVGTFVALKLGLTGLGVWWLSSHREVNLAYWGLRITALMYALALAVHLLLVRQPGTVI